MSRDLGRALLPCGLYSVISTNWSNIFPFSIERFLGFRKFWNPNDPPSEDRSFGGDSLPLEFLTKKIYSLAPNSVMVSDIAFCCLLASDVNGFFRRCEVCLTSPSLGSRFVAVPKLLDDPRFVLSLFPLLWRYRFFGRLAVRVWLREGPFWMVWEMVTPWFLVSIAGGVNLCLRLSVVGNLTRLPQFGRAVH
jgi:hypothetical protein